MKINSNNLSWNNKITEIFLKTMMSGCFCLVMLTTAMAGGPTGTPSHSNDKPMSLASCPANQTRIFSVGYLTNAGRNWNVSVVSGSSWVTLTNSSQKTGNGFVNYQITPNYSGSPRTAIILIDGTPFTIEQKGADENEPCPLQITPNNLVSTASGGYQALNVNDGGQMLKWQITNPGGDNWLSFDSSLQIGSMQTWVGISPNNSDVERITALNIGGVNVPVIQTADLN